MNVGNKKRSHWKRILFWATVIFVSLCLAAFIGFRYVTAKPANPAEVLSALLAIDPESSDRMFQQHRASNLAILGRDDLVRSSRIDSGLGPITRDPSKIDFEFKFRPWQPVIDEVAANERLVMISEGHLLSEHREFIAATLPKFAEEGFTHYSCLLYTSPSPRDRG